MSTNDNNPFRLHPTELNTLRQAAARNGVVINEGDIRSLEDYNMAVFMGLDQKTADDLNSFLETGTYPGMEESLAARAREERELEASDPCSHDDPIIDELAARRAARTEP